MGFNPEGTYLVKVVAVDVGVHAEQAANNRADCIAEIPGEWDTYLVRKDGFIVQKPLRPVHQGIDILWCWELGRPSVLCSVFPQVFISGAC